MYMMCSKLIGPLYRQYDQNKHFSIFFRSKPYYILPDKYH